MEELVDTLRLKLADYLEQNGIERPEKHFKCLHPGHDDKSPSMNMHKDGLYVKCHSCGSSGDIFSVANWIEDKPLLGPEFIQDNIFYLADKFSLKYNIIRSDDAKVAMKYAYLRAYKIASEYLIHVANENPNVGFDKEVKRRRWALKESIKLGLGCADSFSNFIAHLKSNGFTADFIDMVGLNRGDIFNQDGLIFTVYDEYSRPIAFYSRDVRFEEKKAEHKKRLSNLEMAPGKPPMKYNSTANFTGVYEKPQFPYGIHDCRNFHKVIAVEGHGCKHSLKLSGIDNVFALGGLELNDVTIGKMSSLGVTNIVLLLDNDEKGKEKIKNIVRKYFGKSSAEFSVMDMSAVAPDVKDPDEFLRKYSKEAFKTIVEKDCLEWIVMDELSVQDADPYTILQDITPLIALQRSPLQRQKTINLVSELTGIDRSLISEEIDQKISCSTERQGEFAIKVMDEAKELLLMNPENIGGAFSLIETKLNALKENENTEELFSANETLKALVNMQDKQECEDDEPVIKTGFTDFDNHIPIPFNEAFALVMGPPNTGKTALFDSLALRMLEENDDLTVIIHTIDDSRDIYLNRMVAALSRIKINWIKRPKYYLDSDKSKIRSQAFRKIAEYIKDERLIVKDITHGVSAEYHGNLIGHYRERYPNRNIVSFCDNFHRLQYEASQEMEGRHKFRAMSSLMKSYTTRYDCSLFCTVEMTKQDMYTKPTNASGISEAAALQFDANLIIYLWNEMNCEREEADLTFDSKVPEFYPDDGYVYKTVKKPIIEALILKNKLSEFKDSLYFKFHPELALYDEISRDDVREILEVAEQNKTDKGSADSKPSGSQKVAINI